MGYFDEMTFSDDALRVACMATSMRRSSLYSARAERESKLGSKKARMFGRSVIQSQSRATTLSAHVGQQVGASKPFSDISETHEAAYTLPQHMKSTTDIAVRASIELSSKPISEGGLGPYFLAEVFRRENVEADLNAAGQNVPVSSNIIERLSVGMRGDPSARCSICLKHLLSEVATLPCLHPFHKDCILPWLHRHNSCPCCRTPVETSPSPRPAWAKMNVQSIMKRGNIDARAHARGVQQWDGMSNFAIRIFANSAQTLAPIANSLSFERKRKQMEPESSHPLL